MRNRTLWLVGAGSMAYEYVRVLDALNKPFKVIGRSEATANTFELSIRRPVIRGGVDVAMRVDDAPDVAIVAVDIEQLAPTTSALIEAGTKRILLEKPGGLNQDEIKSLGRYAAANDTEISIAYNRRFYGSVAQARSQIIKDAGLLSIRFEFTEWTHDIAPLIKGPGVKESWVISNSSHVLDLAFHLAGRPSDWRCWHAGSLDWHPSSARFCGAGVTEKGVLFSYGSDWQAPGSWSLELLTRKHRMILRPMEKLQVMTLGSTLIKQVASSDDLDNGFKPGLYKQTKAFLDNDMTLFCSLHEQARNVEIYSRIAGYE